MAKTYNTITCPNCGHTHVDTFQYCPSCGQKTEDSIIGFKEMFLDAMGAFFAFDSKAIRSVPKLLFHPGSLTNEYIKGKRESYLAPFRLYLFVSIILFLVLPLVISDNSFFNNNISEFPETLDSLKEIAEAQQNIELDSIVTAAGALTDTLSGDFLPEGKKKVNWTVNTDPNQSIINFNNGDTLQAGGWARAIEMVESGIPVKETVDSIFSEHENWVKMLIRQGIKIQMRKGEGLVNAFLDKASYTLFIFLPIFALFLKLLYVRRKRYYIEHLVFSLHIFSFLFVLIILYVLISRFIVPLPFWPVMAIALIYLYLAMIKVYKQRWGRTLFKWMVLNMTTMILFLPIFFVLALVISLLFY